ncbi:archaeosortase/exosortase family protein [Lentisphaera profundi]|uniref:Archaeosortase/exosortase family protein n=1 Tax=Lentisphaera profundi TaxID=1658616 RepID=A0ABY7VZH9_9BACT|nr:archaeosortase/exosortase family protein [Lentisphaera profundi]WDE98663.1 archaeosortase/exosortase family protein [Lentisphaera profundi]
MKFSLAIVCCLLANWTSLVWLGHRFIASDSHCLVALFILAFFLYRQDWKNTRIDKQALILSSGLSFLTLIGLFLNIPEIALAFIFALNLNLLCSKAFERKWLWPSFALLLLSLPIISSIQFFLGYPLRLFSTQASAILLKIGGIHVQAHGTVLEWQGRQTIVDAPCSGINMLWAGLLLIAIIAIHEKMKAKAFFKFFGLGFCLIIASNIIRNTALFYLENTPLELPEFSHSAVGLFIFTLYIFAILFIQKRSSHAKTLC